jgi:hypothetical protein
LREITYGIIVDEAAMGIPEEILEEREFGETISMLMACPERRLAPE